MTGRRRVEGRETWRRLRDWEGGQSPAERLAAHVLRMEGYAAVDPSHPLGGPDGLKDLICVRDGRRCVGAAFFPRGQGSFRNLEAKFSSDLEGASRNNATIFAFVTNQELPLSERAALVERGNGMVVDLFHLERIASLLDSPPCYGLRLEFLDIEMTHEEQLAFLASRDQLLEDLRLNLSNVLSQLKELKDRDVDNGAVRIPSAPMRSQPTVSVVPTTINSVTDLFFRRTLHKCSICDFGFLVAEDSLAFVGILGGDKVVTCPKCRNTEKYWPLR